MAKITSKEKTSDFATSANVMNESVKASVSKKSGYQGPPFLFDKENYYIMFAGLVVIIIGYMLMSGGKSSDPNVFNESEIYSFRRITLAPILVLLGLAIEGYAIMKKPKQS